MEYSGLCIGGPLDRKRVDNLSNRLYAEVSEPLSLPLGIGAPEPVATKTYVYQHVFVGVTDQNGQDTAAKFWVPADEKDPHRYVLQELISAYETGPDS